jgi:membrane protease YdiL (CAAX protease family)
MITKLDDQLRGFGPVGVVTTVVIVGLAGRGALLVLAWAWITKTPWRDIGFSMPPSWVAEVSVGIVGGIALKLALKAVVMPSLGAAPANATYHFLVGNSAALPGMIITLIVRAGFGEEVVFRGFLFERLGRLIGPRPYASTVIVLVSSALFSVAHYPDQGRDGAVQAAITGMVFGATFAATRRLWIVMIAHAAFDLTALALIYYDLERAVAHAFFKQP